jgi:hypothetical protein
MSARNYEIRIQGRVGEALQAAFEGMAVTINPVETVVRGEMLDQAALYGLLGRIQELGLEVVEVRRLPSGPDAAGGRSQPPAPT